MARVGSVDRSRVAVDAVRRVRRALPGDPGFGDPLSAAGSRGAAPVARVAARMFDEEPRALREAGLGALQVWQSVLERRGRGRGDAEVALLFTDLVGFSHWALRVGDDVALHLLRDVARASEPCVGAHRGQVVKRLGDGLMAVFPAPDLAVAAVCAMQDRVAEVDVAGHRPRLRAGVHRGRPRRIGDDYLGVDVNVAARLVEKARADEVLVSGPAAQDLDPGRYALRRRKSFQLHRVKGVPQDLVVYAVTRR